VETFHADFALSHPVSRAPSLQSCREVEHLSTTRVARVLLVEDDDEMRNLLARYLRRAGYDVTEAHDGIAALVRLGETINRRGFSTFDLVISDIRMPGPDGLNLVAELRSCDWATPVILITAFGTADTHDKARRLGAEILDKPLDLEQLERAVKRLLA